MFLKITQFENFKFLYKIKNYSLQAFNSLSHDPSPKKRERGIILQNLNSQLYCNYL